MCQTQRRGTAHDPPRTVTDRSERHRAVGVGPGRGCGRRLVRLEGIVASMYHLLSPVVPGSRAPNRDRPHQTPRARDAGTGRAREFPTEGIAGVAGGCLPRGRAAHAKNVPDKRQAHGGCARRRVPSQAVHASGRPRGNGQGARRLRPCRSAPRQARSADQVHVVRRLERDPATSAVQCSMPGSGRGQRSTHADDPLARHAFESLRRASRVDGDQKDGLQSPHDRPGTLQAHHARHHGPDA